MKENFDIYERYNMELEMLQERKDKLQEIQAKNEQYDKLRATIGEQEYVIRRLRVVLEEEQLESLRQDVTRINEELRKLADELAFARTKYEEARDEAERAFTRLTHHDDKRRKDELEAEISDLQRLERRLLTDLSETYRALEEERALITRLAGWEGNEKWQWEEENRETMQSGILAIKAAADLMAETMEQVGTSDRLAERLDSLREFLTAFAAQIGKVHEAMLIQCSRAEEEINRVQARIKELEQIIRDLENKKRPYPYSVTALRQLLEQRLGGRSPVWIFCEEMEVEDERWRNAVEGYLNTQRFDLLVHPDAFAEALSVYEREKFKHGIEGVGLVDTEKERSWLHTAEDDTLARVVTAENPVIQAHIEHLLGRVKLADNEQELRRHRTAVTRSCMVYHNLTARQMKRSAYDPPYIGTKAIARQLELRRQELAEVKQQLDSLNRMHQQFSFWAEQLADKKSLLEQYARQLDDILRLTEARTKREVKQRELNSLDLSEVERLEAEYRLWRSREGEWNDKQTKLVSLRALKQDRHDQLVSQIYIQQNRLGEAQDRLESWQREYDPTLLQGSMARWADAERLDAPTARKLENWLNNQKGNMTRRDDARMELYELRARYNVQYSFDGQVNAEDNREYDVLLQTIVDLDIPLFQEKVAKALQESEEEFKSHFVFKLREAIEMARREFFELNHALRNFPFSEDRYAFEITPSEKYRKYYDAVMNPNLGEKGSLFDLADADRETAQTLHELFERLVRGEAGDGKKNLRFNRTSRKSCFDVMPGAIWNWLSAQR